MGVWKPQEEIRHGLVATAFPALSCTHRTCSALAWGEVQWLGAQSCRDWAERKGAWPASAFPLPPAPPLSKTLKLFPSCL